jgi:serine protease AprX
MKQKLQRVAFIAFALIALYMATLGLTAPVMADQGGLQTAKIDAALLKLMQTNPKGEWAVIVQTTMPNTNLKANTTADSRGLPNLKDMRNAQGVFDARQAMKRLSAQRSRWAADRIRASAGKRLNNLAIIGGSAATLNYAAITKLSLDPFVSRIHLDKKIAPLGNPGSLSLYTQMVRATEVWAQGFTGQGISVAIVDSGIAPVDDVSLPASRIAATIDLSDAPAGGDPGGHGTHVAGIVAGNGTDSAHAREGVAPGAKVINVRVIDANGSASLSSVIRGIEWVIQNRKTYNIRVMNLSLGADAVVGYRDDPLSAAVEMAWNAGIVVVTAAGNGNNVARSIVTPGIDPYVITVGSLDEVGIAKSSNDKVAPFSSFGPTIDGLAKPDVVAPGRKIISLRSIGSYLDNLLPDRRTDNSYFRLSGTSMAAPVVSGAVALMLQKTPGLKPDQIKYILTHTATPVAQSLGANITGSGVIDAYAAVNSTLNGKANRGLTPSDNFAKSVFPILKGMSLATMWRDPNYRGINWRDVTWDDVTWDRTAWDNFKWEDVTWDNTTWTDVTWDDVTWDDVTWDTSSVPNNMGVGWDAARKLN